MKFSSPEQIEKVAESMKKDPIPFMEGHVPEKTDTVIDRFLKAGWRYNESSAEGGAYNEKFEALEALRYSFQPCFEETIAEEDALLIDGFVKEVKRVERMVYVIEETRMEISAILDFKNEFTGQHVQCVDPVYWNAEDFNRKFKYPERFYPPNYMMIEKKPFVPKKESEK